MCIMREKHSRGGNVPLKVEFDEMEALMIEEMMKTLIKFFPSDTEICRHAKYIRNAIEQAEERYS